MGEQYVLAPTGQGNEAGGYGKGDPRYGASTRLLVAIIVGAIIIAVGLAIGLAIGLSNNEVRELEENHDNGARASDSPEWLSSKLGRYRFAAVAADATICSDIGTEILGRKGGSAVDAAVAALFCMGVANLHSMGIGGGFFATIYDSKSKSVAVLDAREAAPGASTMDMYRGDRRKSMFGGLSIGVPGEVAGYWAMHQRYGRLPWSQLLQPTIDLCERGFPFTAAADRAAQRVAQRNMLTGKLREFLVNPETGEPTKEGETFRCERLAKSLRVLAAEGGSSFYNGSLAQDIVQDIQDNGGIITKGDLTSYQAKWKNPISFRLKDNSTLYSVPAPSSGAVLTLILSILEGFDFSNKSLSTVDATVLTYHRIAEAMKFAYAKRTNLGDGDFVPDVAELEKLMVSPGYGESLRQKISDEKTFGTEHYGATFHDEMTPGTAQISLSDPDGNAVSVTSTVNLYFGSGVVGERTGIIFNDEMDDFSSPNVTNAFGIKPSPANFISPGKRPLSSMCPAIILKGDNEVRMVTGASGGSKITTAIALVILRSLRLGQDLKTATDAPRFHHQLLPPELQLEEGRFSQEIIDGLKAKGHGIRTTNPRGSVVQSVLMEGKYVLGISDDRKSADADGY